MKTKMLIIGGGWVGYHLAYSFRNHCDVVIFEKEKSLFTQTSRLAPAIRERKCILSQIKRFINDNSK